MGDVKIRFSGDARGALSALREMDKSLRGFKENIIAANQAMNLISRAIQSASQALGRFRTALDLGGKLSDLTAQTGESVRNLVLLRQALQNAGLGADSLLRVSSQLQRALGEINEDSATTADALDALGLSASELRNASLTEQITQLSAAFGRVGNAADRAAIAQRIFGRSGAELLSLFAETEPLARAEREVGGLADTLQDSADVFDSISDSLTTVGQKFTEFAAGALSQVAPQLASLTRSLAETDLTRIGATAGAALQPFIRLAEVLNQFRGTILGLAAAYVVLNARTQAAMATAQAAIVTGFQRSTAAIVAFRAQLATAGGGFAGLAAQSRIAFTSIVTGARAAAVAIKGAIAATGIGLLIVGATELVTRTLALASAWKRVGNEIQTISRENAKLTEELAAARGNVANEVEQLELRQRINAEIQRERDLIAEARRSGDFNARQLAEITRNRQANIDLLNIQLRQTDRLTQADFERARAARIRNEQESQAARKAEEVARQLPQIEARLADARRKAEFYALTAVQQRDRLLREIDAQSIADLDRQIAAYREIDTLTDRQVIRSAELLRTRTELIAIEGRIAAAARAREAAESEASNRLALIRAEIEAFRSGNDAILQQEQDRQRLIALQNEFAEKTGDPARAAILAERQLQAEQARRLAEGHRDTATRILTLGRENAEIAAQLEGTSELLSISQQLANVRRRANVATGEKRRLLLEQAELLKRQRTAVRQRLDDESRARDLAASRAAFQREITAEVNAQQRTALAFEQAQASAFASDRERADLRRAALDAESTALVQQLALLQERAALIAGDELATEELDQLRERITATEDLLATNRALSAEQERLATFAGQLQVNFQRTFDQAALSADRAAQIISTSLNDAITGISRGLTDAITGAKSFGEAMLNVANQVIAQLIQMTIQALLFRAVLGVFTGGVGLAFAKGGEVPGYNTGGLIAGAPSDRDNRIARVATGEYIVRASSVKHYGAALFAALNNRALPRMSLGGLPIPRASSAPGFSTGGLVGRNRDAQDAEGRDSGNVNIAIFDDRNAANEWLQSREGRRALVRTTAAARGSIGVAT